MNKETLYKLHKIQKLSIDQISKKYNIGTWKLRKLLKKYQIKSNGRFAPNKIKITSKIILEDLYSKEFKSMLEIGKILNVSNVTIRKWLKKYNIKLRSHQENQKYTAKKIIHKMNDPEFQKYLCQCRINKHGNLFTKINGTQEESVRNFFEETSFYSFDKNYKICDTKELDGYSSELRIAFEYGSLWWHKESKYRTKNYHKNKFDICRKKGIKLFTIFDDEWLYRNAQVKGLISSVLSNNNRRIVNIRDCDIRKISGKIIKDFIKEYHINPLFKMSIFSFGIYQNDELLGCAAFSEYNRNTIILDRLVFKDNIFIKDGANELFSYGINAISQYHRCVSCIAWSDNRWSLGKEYEDLGFKNIKEYGPNYFYIHKKKTNTRIAKKFLSKKATDCPEYITENEFAFLRGYYRVWDCGKIKWEYSK